MLKPRQTPPATIPQPYRATARSRVYPKTAGERLVIKSVTHGRSIKKTVAITDPSEPTPIHAMTSISRMQTSPGKMARIGSASRLTLLAIRFLRSCRLSPQPALYYSGRLESCSSIFEALFLRFSNLSRSAATTSLGARSENSPSSNRSKRVI